MNRVRDTVGVCVVMAGLSAFAVKTPQKIEIPSSAKYEYSEVKTQDQAFKVEIQKWSVDKGEVGVISVISAEPFGGCVLKKKFTSAPVFIEQNGDALYGSVAQNGVLSKKSRLSLKLPLSVDHYIRDGHLDDVEGEVSRSLHCDVQDHFAAVHSTRL